MENTMIERLTYFAYICRARGEGVFTEPLLNLIEENHRLTKELEEIKKDKERTNPLISLLDIWVKEHNGNEIPTREMFLQLQDLAEQKGIEFPFAHARALGLKLQAIWKELEKIYNCNYRNGTGNIRYYTFSKRDVRPADFFFIRGLQK